MNSKTVDLALLVLRLALGITMVMHGAQKVGLIGDGSIQSTVDGMAKGGIPAVLAYCSIAAELLGGIALIVGFLGRLAALAVLINMCVAIFKVHFPHGFFLGKNGMPNGYEFTFVLAAMALALLLTGMGSLSVDARLSGRGRTEGA